MKKTHHTPEYKLMRAVCLWLHALSCHNCGQTGYDIHVHHIDKNPVNNCLINLKPLCESCHKLHHKIPVQPYFTKKQIDFLLLRKFTNPILK